MSEKRAIFRTNRMLVEDLKDRCKWCLAVGRGVTEAGTRDVKAFCSEQCRDQYEQARPVIHFRGKEASKEREKESKKDKDNQEETQEED